MPALTPADLPQATFHVKKTSWGGGGFQIVALQDGDLLGELSIALPLGMGECHGAYEVTRSFAEVRGIGPLLYDIAMELAGKRGIMSDRRSVSPDARRVWKFYDSRADTKKKQLDNPQGWLTPEDESDDCRQDSAGKNWVESPLSRVNYKNSTPVLDDLRRRGMLRMAGASRTACIIAAGQWDGHKCLFKNRDRNYTPKVKVYHVLKDGVEILYMKDEITGWCEGINSSGIGIVNSALAVAKDEKEKRLTEEDAEGATLRDGKRVLEALSKTSVDDAVESIKTFDKGLKGHTFVADTDRTVSLEATWEGHDYHIRQLANDKKHVRTNHGQYHQDAGYTEDDGDDYLSSLARRDQAMKVIRGVDSYEQIAPAIYGKRRKDRSDPLNMVKLTDGMKSTSQIVLDLSDLTVYLYLLPDQVEFLGYQNDLPKNRKPKLTLKVMQYTDLDDEGGFEVEEVDTTRSLSASRVASWMRAKRFFPGVRNPVFHATTGPRAANIALGGEGIKSNSGFSSFGAGNYRSISLSRDLNFLLKGGFGNVIFVLDRDELNRKFPVDPHAYDNWEDEYEERVFTDKIPASMIRGVIFRYKPLGFELDEWKSKVEYPVAYIDGREWGSKTALVKTATTIPEILGNCGPDVTQRAGKVKYKRKRLSPSGLSTWSATGSKGEEYIIRVKPIRKDKRLKQVAKMPVQIACSCPYFRWQGPEHWAVQNEYLYGKPRGTASVPVIKDPLSEHWACKHAIAVLQLVQKYRYAGEGGWDWTGPVIPVSPHELDEGLVKRVASIEVYKPLSEAGPKVEELLSRRTPTWLDRDYPYVSPPGKSGTLAELEYLVSLIPLREKWASFIRAADEDAEGLFMGLCSELGVPCDRKTLDEMVSEALVLITKLKWLYNRPRPYQVAERAGRSDFYVLDSVSAHTPAYPSGHTIQAYLLASRLSELAPQHRGAFMDLAHKISFSRAVAGYHWPSDLTYAKDLYRHIVSPHMPSSVRVANRFRESQG